GHAAFRRVAPPAHGISDPGEAILLENRFYRRRLRRSISFGGSACRCWTLLFGCARQYALELVRHHRAVLVWVMRRQFAHRGAQGMNRLVAILFGNAIAQT